jgi:hypothetical protein
MAIVILTENESSEFPDLEILSLRERSIFFFTINSKYINDKVKYTYSQRVYAIRSRIQRENLLLN